VSAQHIREAIARCAAQRSDVVCAYLFGSHAKGAACAQSDVDVAVLLDSGADGALGPMVEIEQALRAALPGLQIDVVILNEAPLRLRFEVMTTGSLLFDAHADERVDFEVTTQMLYLDWQRTERQFDEAAMAWAQGGEVR